MWFSFTLLFFLSFSIAEAQNADVQISGIVPGCGNGILEAGEGCDGLAFAGKTCTSLGFASGQIQCSAVCAIDTSACVIPVQRTTSQVQRGLFPTRLVTQSLNIRGVSIPSSTIWLLRRGVRIASTRSLPDGSFSFSVPLPDRSRDGIALFAQTDDGFRSGVSTIAAPVVGQGTVLLDSVFLSPSVDMSKTTIVQGEPIEITGMVAPGSRVSAVVYRDGKGVLNVRSDSVSGGNYSFLIPSDTLPPGAYTVIVYATISDRISSPSRIIGFTVGTISLPRFRDSRCPYQRGDLNNDCRVNDSDTRLFISMLQAPGSETLLEFERLSGDGVITMQDFSILMYNWTG